MLRPKRDELRIHFFELATIQCVTQKKTTRRWPNPASSTDQQLGRQLFEKVLGKHGFFPPPWFPPLRQKSAQQ